MAEAGNFSLPAKKIKGGNCPHKDLRNNQADAVLNYYVF
jgi:hypothetical protein